MKPKPKSDPPLELPWFKVMVWDWLNSERIAACSLEQEAIYMRLLMRQWVSKDGFLPGDPEALRRYARLETPAQWRRLGKPVIDRFFERRNGHYWNAKLRELWEDAREKHETKQRAGKAGAAARWQTE